MMTIERAAHVLRKFNDYRRLDHEPCDPPFTAAEIGQAIDVAVGVLEGKIGADIDSIISAVSRETGVTEEEMCRKGRQRRYAEARAIAGFLAYRYTPMTLMAIGERLGRDHAVVLYHIRKVSEWLDNPRLNPEGAMITKKLMNAISQ